MKNILLAALMVFSPTICGAVEFDEDAVKTSCATDWKDSDELQKACLKSAQDSHAKMMQRYDQSDAMDQIALDLCIERWSHNWIFVADCFDEQWHALIDTGDFVTALANRSPGVPWREINDGCLIKWRPDQARQLFCIRHMAFAWIDAN